MSRVADWEIEEPFRDIQSVLKSNTQIRGREDVEQTLRDFIKQMRDVSHQLEIAVQKQIIEDAEGTLTTARAALASLEPTTSDLPF